MIEIAPGLQLVVADCFDALRGLDDGSVDAICTDPPYGINFMGKAWDGKAIEEAASRPRDLGGVERLTGDPDHPERRKMTARTGSAFANRAGEAGAYDFSVTGNRAFQAWTEAWAREAYRVLKPGGHLLCFASTRTYHRMASGVEDAGFEVRDTLAWLFGSGFPKSLNVGCRCDEEGLDGDGDLYELREGVPNAASVVETDEASSLLGSLQGHPERPDLGEARAQGIEGPNAGELRDRSSEDARPVEPSMEGRRDIQASEGELPERSLREGTGLGARDGEEGRLRDGAPPRHGDDDRAATLADGGRPSPGSRPSEQRPDESRTVADESRSQALGGWTLCPRCGLPTEGIGTALKPAFEPIVVARKPLSGTVAATVLAHGTGALNIDGCRVAFQGEDDESEAKGKNRHADFDSGPRENAVYGTDDRARAEQGNYDPPGRWPANVVLDEDAGALLDASTGDVSVGHWPSDRPSNTFGLGHTGQQGLAERHAESGGPSRFFYCAKVSRAERAAGLESFEEGEWSDGREAPADNPRLRGQTRRANVHPTVKPIALMRWLIRLVTPPGGVVLDPFLGSGSTGCAAALEGMRFLGIERETDYAAIAEARIRFWAEHGEEALRVVAEQETGARLREAIAETGQLDLLAGA